MDLAKVLAHLRAELKNLDIAIASIEKLAAQMRAAPPEVLVERERARARRQPEGLSALPPAIRKRKRK